MLSDLFLSGFFLDWSQIREDSYLCGIPALRGMESMEFHSPVTFFVGENGTGKSTLLEAIALAWGFNPEGGSRNFRFSTRDTHSSLYEGMRLRKGWRQPEDYFFLRAESFYNVATQVEEYREEDDPAVYYRSYGGRSLHEQSHGESFLNLVQSRFRGKGFYLLDEPEAALSPQRQLTLLISLHELVAAGSQFLIASHSPILLGMPGADIRSFDGGAVEPVSYEETQSFQVTEMFLNHREYLLRRLLNRNDEKDGGER